jgi:hypothetical protein
MTTVAAEELIEALYGLPLEEFTKGRDQAARELRSAGNRDEAEQVKGLRKPTAAAAKVNRLVRDHRREVEAFLGAAAALRDAQLAGQGSLGPATEREREALGRLVQAGGEAVRQTLLAAAVDDEAARELLTGRLERELEPRGFGTLLTHAPRAAKPAVAKRAPREPAKPDDRAALARLGAASEALARAEAEERQAHRLMVEAQSAVEKARKAAEQAQLDVDRLRGR